MKIIFKPIFNLIINILAYSLLGALFYFEFDSNFYFGLGITVSLILIFMHFVYWRKDEFVTKQQHLVFVVVAVIFMFIMLIFYGVSIKRSDYFLLFISLASISPFYNFCGYVRFTQIDENTSLLEYLIGILSVPFTVFLVYSHYSGTNYKTIYMIIAVMAYYFVIFSIIKIIALFLKEKNITKLSFESPRFKKRVTLFMTIIIPLTALFLNQYMYSGTSEYAKQTGTDFSRQHYGFFGDFSHPIFYVITLLNGLTLIIPLLDFNKLKLPIFYLRSIGFSFIVYMCIVFLPIIPFGILALFFIVGFYVFVPFFIFWWQGKILLQDYRVLLQLYKKKQIVTVFILGFLTLPILMIPVFVYDKINFQNAIVYLDSLSDNKNKEIDLEALDRTLGTQKSYSYVTNIHETKIKAHYTYRNIPIISSIYKLYVLNGKYVDWDSMYKIDSLFYNEDYYDYSYYYNEDSLDILDRYTENKPIVKIKDLKLDTKYDDSNKVYRTWVDIELENSSEENNEYKTLFYLPEGAYISDYYLYVGEDKKMGLLTDERAAVSIYKKIVLSKLDPGILHYLNDFTLELRVFPFSAYEKRKTGFEIIHLGSLDFELDNKRIKVDVEETQAPKLDNAILLKYEEIKDLPLNKKTNNYNFIVDCSKGTTTDYLISRIDDYCYENNIHDASIYFTTYKVEKHSLKDVYSTDIDTEGGFNLDLAVRTILKDNDPDEIPIIIYLTPKEKDEIIRPSKVRDYLTPESEFYYELLYDNILVPYSLFTNTNYDEVEQPIIQETVSYKGISVIDDGEDKLVILNETPEKPSSNQYVEAMNLTVENKINLKNGKRNPLSYIRRSFEAHVLAPATAFIVVETKEQEEELLKLQEKILKEQERLEASENNLKEPPIVIVIVLMCGIYFIYKSKNKFLGLCPKPHKGIIP